MSVPPGPGKTTDPQVTAWQVDQNARLWMWIGTGVS